jgi:predicted S18 family serine protease
MSDEERDDRNDNALPREGDLLRWAEKTQRTIDFMLQQQAQYQAQSEARQAESEAQRTEAEARYERIEAIVERIATASLRRFEGVEGEVSSLDRKMEALVDSHIRMADTHKEVEERLNAFIATVERLINERRNGGSKGGVLDE